MFAVIKTGSKQYKVEVGTVVDVEKLNGEIGSSVSLNDVLLVSGEKGIAVGQPIVNGAVVNAEIVQQKKGPKLIIFKKRRRQGYHLKKGHRQELTRIKVTEINY
ncbi:MAG: 50S ribosomal protein L21 [Deltaproteobacteria bacterium]|jgi:large subunit ribosomal protein L21|nr:50S ribosomal protein L21 [Deltaproteobacteria bacterium]